MSTVIFRPVSLSPLPSGKSDLNHLSSFQIDALQRNSSADLEAAQLHTSTE